MSLSQYRLADLGDKFDDQVKKVKEEKAKESVEKKIKEGRRLNK